MFDQVDFLFARQSRLLNLKASFGKTRRKPVGELLDGDKRIAAFVAGEKG
jgi:hypothetical protein